MENAEAPKPQAEQQKPLETAAAESGLNFESPEASEKLKAEAASETAEFASGGLPIAEHLASRLDMPVDETTKAELGAVAGEAEAAKAELDVELTGETPEQLERQETIRETREYRDVEGKLLGMAVLEFAPEEVVKSDFKTIDGRPGTCRKLLSFKMQGERDGEKTETDLLALAKKGDTEVWIGTERLQNYYSNSEQKYVTAPPLESTVDVATLLHELGHANQRREDRFGGLSHEDELAKVEGSPSRIPEALRQVRVAFPEAGEAIDRIDPDYLKSLEEIQERVIVAADKAYRFEKQASSATGEKDGIMSEAAQAAFEKKTGVGISQFQDRLQDAPESERATMLEQAGFEFAPDAPPLPERSATTRIGFGRKSKPPGGLPRESTASYEVANELLMAFRHASMKDVRGADDKTGTLELSLPVSVRGEKRLVTLKIDVGADGLRAMTERQAAKDAEAAAFRLQAQGAKAEQHAINAEYDAKMEERQVPALLNLPRNVLERDATRRAFGWMRTLRNENGVDLFATTVVAKDALILPEKDSDCVPSVTEALTAPDAPDLLASDAQSDLSNALKSYGARRFRFRNRDDAGDIGVMPRPGSDRK